MKLRQPHLRSLSLQRPFAGQGVSAYVGDTLPLRYRNLRLDSARLTTRVFTGPKCNRIAVETGAAGDPLEFDVDLSAYAPGTVYADLRHFRDDVEWTGSHPQRIVLDEAGETVRSIRGRAQVIKVEPRVGGVVKIYFRWTPAAEGDQPTRFELVRISGPTSPANVVMDNESFPVPAMVFEIFTAALEDSDTYGFELHAVIPAVLDEDDEIITPEYRVTVAEIADVQPDATGPPAVESLSVEVV